MSESINVENKKQNHLKPPRSLARIACEILAGTATGLSVVPLVFVACIMIMYQRYGLVGEGDLELFQFMTLFAIVCPPLYGLASAVGVYLLGTRGKQTGSFLLTLIGGFLGGLFMFVMLLLAWFLSTALIVGVEWIVLWTLVVLILLIPPIFATLGFNLRRRHK